MNKAPCRNAMGSLVSKVSVRNEAVYKVMHFSI